ncbi:MAG: phosphatase PAP2 family protein [Erythrobacter sp.]|nr:phosphatase PAP2 family protein [Erythrobacter sp.]
MKRAVEQNPQHASGGLRLLTAPNQRSLFQRWLSEIPIFMTSLALFFLCVGLLKSKGIRLPFDTVSHNASLFFAFFLFGVLGAIPFQLIRHRPESPFQYLKARYWNKQIAKAFAGGLPLLLIAIAIIPFFSEMKAAIPLFTTYSWDSTFIKWDQTLFFGYDPWTVLQPALGFPIITAFLALLYHLWLLLLYPGVLVFAFANVDNNLRNQFFLSYVLSWSLIGGLMATLLASVGPCFVGPLLDNPHFDAQIAYLEIANDEIPVMTLRVQEMLLERFTSNEAGLGSGITAMPSMHCAIAFLYWIAVRKVSSRLGCFFGVFSIVIWISSVHLAYHYAIDGLVSLFAVAVIWKLSGSMLLIWNRWTKARYSTFRANTTPAE